MKLEDLFVTGAVAGVTTLAALALIAPSEVNASRDDVATVNVGGVEVSVRTAKARRRPTAELVMHNPTEEAVVMRGNLRLYETSLANAGGRMAQPSRERWDRNCLYVLNAGETKRVKLRSKKKLRKKTMGHFTFTARSGKRREVLYTASFVPKRKATPTSQMANSYWNLEPQG